MPRRTKPNSHPAKVQNALIKAQTDAVMAADEGRKKHLTEDQVYYALTRLADGDTMMNVTKHLNVSRSAFWVRAHDNPAFADTLKHAIELGMLARVENAENAVWGGEMSTGSIERDKLAADYTKWMASKLNRPLFGDKAMIEAHGLTINVKSDSDDLC